MSALPARVHRKARHTFDSRDPAIRNALRGIAASMPGRAARRSP
jgi:hypothetical protein